MLVVLWPCVQSRDILLQEEQRVGGDAGTRYITRNVTVTVRTMVSILSTSIVTSMIHCIVQRLTVTATATIALGHVYPTDRYTLPARLQHLLFQVRTRESEGTPDGTGNISFGTRFDAFLVNSDDRGAPVKMVEAKRCRNLWRCIC